jgi:hypothetical protein
MRSESKSKLPSRYLILPYCVMLAFLLGTDAHAVRRGSQKTRSPYRSPIPKYKSNQAELARQQNKRNRTEAERNQMAHDAAAAIRKNH